MNLYERINKKESGIPDCFDISVAQMLEIADNARGRIDAVCTAFKFGYMQGVRAEKIGKAGKIE